MIRRNVNGQHWLRTLTAVDHEFLRQEAEQVAACGVLQEDHTLEPVLVVWRERNDELLYGGIDRPEDRHPQQVPFRALQDTLSQHVGRERANQHHQQRRGQDAEPRHIALEPRREDRPDEPVDEPENPDEREDADGQRDRDEEPRNDTASNPEDQ